MNHNPASTRIPALILVVIGAVALTGCGTETTVIDTSDGDPAQAACDDRLDALVEQLRVDVAYDYEPSDSPAELGATVDAVVTATLGKFSQDGENVTAVLEDVEVIGGDTRRGGDGDLAISWYVSPEPRDLGDTDGISVLAFLWDQTDTPQPDIEGLWFGCGSVTPARSMIVTPIEPGWPAGIDATITNLALAVTDPDGGAASATETFAIGSLICYEDIAESSTAMLDASAIGFDTPQEAADDWWTDGDGRLREDRDRLDEEIEVPEIRYVDEWGNPQLVLQISDPTGRGWLVVGTEACVAS